MCGERGDGPLGRELIDWILELLGGAGIRAEEEYPAGAQVELRSPAAAVGLRSLDLAEGTAELTVRVLSPRYLGGWSCQNAAAQASAALHGNVLSVRTGEMEYHSGSDCFCVELTVRMAVVRNETSVAPGDRWKILVGDIAQAGVRSFRAVRSQDRRLVGAHFSGTCVGVTPGSGGWELELVQHCAGMPAEPEEPFVLTVRGVGVTHRYTGCCWNETVAEYTQGGLMLTRRGFALAREEDGNG